MEKKSIKLYTDCSLQKKMNSDNYNDIHSVKICYYKAEYKGEKIILPKNIKYLIIDDNIPKEQEIDIPYGLNEYRGNIKFVHLLPNSVEKIHINLSGYDKQININFPEQLKELYISGSYTLEGELFDKQFKFPYKLVKLQINVSEGKIRKIPDNLPLTLEFLAINNSRISIVNNISHLVNLKCLYIMSNEIEKIYIEKLINLKKLNLNTNKLSYIDSFPKNLEWIDLSNNILENMPKLPDKLKILRVENNKLIKYPKYIPETLEEIYIYNGNNIENKPEKVWYKIDGHDLISSKLFEQPNYVSIELFNSTIDNIQEQFFIK